MGEWWPCFLMVGCKASHVDSARCDAWFGQGWRLLLLILASLVCALAHVVCRYIKCAPCLCTCMRRYAIFILHFCAPTQPCHQILFSRSPYPQVMHLACSQLGASISPPPPTCVVADHERAIPPKLDVHKAARFKARWHQAEVRSFEQPASE
jgi:hypothetical protein